MDGAGPVDRGGRGRCGRSPQRRTEVEVPGLRDRLASGAQPLRATARRVPRQRAPGGGEAEGPAVLLRRTRLRATHVRRAGRGSHHALCPCRARREGDVAVHCARGGRPSGHAAVQLAGRAHRPGPAAWPAARARGPRPQSAGAGRRRLRLPPLTYLRDHPGRRREAALVDLLADRTSETLAARTSSSVSPTAAATRPRSTGRSANTASAATTRPYASTPEACVAAPRPPKPPGRSPAHASSPPGSCAHATR